MKLGKRGILIALLLAFSLGINIGLLVREGLLLRAQPSTEGPSFESLNVEKDLTVGGKVGIGTTEPQEKLQVSGNFIQIDGAAGEKAHIGGDGYPVRGRDNPDIEIGSVNPNVLDASLWNPAASRFMNLFAGEGWFKGPLTSERSGQDDWSAGFLHLVDTRNGTIWHLANRGTRADPNNPFEIVYFDGQNWHGLYLKITSTGNVGIGTADPQAKLHVVGDIVKTGRVSFIQSHPTDPTKEIVYVALEGPEAGTYIRGIAQLQNGEAIIDLPEHFSLVTSDEGLTVQLTCIDECNGLRAVWVSTKQIEVRELFEGRSNARFYYLVQGARKGYEHHQVIQEKAGT